MPKNGYFKSNLDLSKFNKKVLVALDREIITTGYEIETEAKRNVAVDTGRLRGSINTEVRNKEIKVGAYTNYASYVEYGTTKQKAQPFLYPAFKIKTHDLLKRLLAIVENENSK